MTEELKPAGLVKVEDVEDIVETVRREAETYDVSENRAGESACREISLRLAALPRTPAAGEGLREALRGCVEHMEWSTRQGHAAFKAAVSLLAALDKDSDQ